MSVWTFGFTNAKFYVGTSKTNMSLVNDGDTIIGGIIYYKLVADEGYSFVHDTETPDRPCVISDYEGKVTTINMHRDTTTEVANTVYYYDSLVSTANLKGTVTVHATAQSVNDVRYTITPTVTNATTNINGVTEYAVDEVVHVTVSPNDGYYFATAPTISMGGTTYTMIETDGGYYYDLTITGNAELTAKAVQMATYSFTVNVTNATSNISPDTVYNAGDVVHIEVTADEGYYFATAPYISYTWSGVAKTLMLLSDDEGDYKTNFYCDFEILSTFSQWGLTLKANAQVIPVNDKYGIITMYNPTPTELKQIGNVRYMGGVDLGTYISSLIKVYVKIPKDKTANVLLGGYDTGVVSNAIIDDIVETDCGTIDITGKYGNLMDYQHTNVEIYLPFIGFKTLDTDKVMNETLQLIYKTNVINGDTIACIYNTTGTLIYTFNCRASFEIPYTLNDNVESTGRLDVDSNYLFGFTPFVTIRCNKEYNTANIVANDNRVTTLAELQGYVTCSQVFNTIKATTAEKNEIDTLLQSGVIV